MRYYAQQDDVGNWIYTIILYGNKENYDNIALRFEEQKEVRYKSNEFLCISETSEGVICKGDDTRLHRIGLIAGELKRFTIRFKMSSRRFALRVTSTLDNENSESETA